MNIEIQQIKEHIDSLNEKIKIEEKSKVKRKKAKKELISSIENYSGNKTTEYYIANIPEKKNSIFDF